MERNPKLIVNENALRLAVVEIKLLVNRRLFQKGVLTEEMYTKAKELILKDDRPYTYSVS